MPMTPITAAEFAALMSPLGPFEARLRVAVAVSGGADSLALALLADQWAKALGGEVIALTVDHRLRANSATEAARVGQWLAARHIPHRILSWDGPKPAADLQAQARAARYRLLEEFCRAEGVLHVLLGHHRDDQAETLLMRLGRGSGVDGLAAMASVQEGFALRWLRPLLPLPRARLAATLIALGQDWVEDPSNANDAFARARLRKLIPVLATEGLSPERLAATAKTMGRARVALETMVAETAARWVTLHPAGFAVADPQAFAHPPDDVGLRLLTRLLMCVGGGTYAPRAERSEKLFWQLKHGLTKAVTLGGCRIAPCSEGLLFSREPARMAPPVALVPGAELSWDGRFRLKVAEDAPIGLVLGALGVTGWNRVAGMVKPRRLPVLPAAVRATLPTIYGDDAISAVPHLGYNRSLDTVCALRWIVAVPSSPLTVAGHCLV
ncbi:MAG: tRNA lysidine(34) synthetase TilS [Rhodospirillaceae bacterium]|nr:tRNA lysidine(34) synthetase TilS [Rhodospirillales bacterium]